MDGFIGCCYILIFEDGECMFVINEGYMNKLCFDSILEEVFDKVLVLVVLLYLMCGKLEDFML